MKKQRDTITKSRKVGKPLKEFIPTTVKDPPRDQQQLAKPEINNRSFKAWLIPSTIPKEWPGDEEALVI